MIDWLTPQGWQAVSLSLKVSLWAVAVSLPLGIFVAYALARWRFPGHGLLNGLVHLPLVLPPVVGGVALLAVLGRSGLLGRPLFELTGFAFPFTPYAVVLAQTFVALPFLVLSVEGALRSADQRFEDAAATLGASPLVVFCRVTLPLVLPDAGHDVMFRRSAARARAAGLTATPLVQTAADVLAWDRERGEPPLSVGLTEEQEAQLLR